MGAAMMGARVKRLEDPRLLRGQASFVDDLRLPGVLHAAILRSSHAHARIRKIDLSAVRAAPGVVDAFCLADVWESPPTIPVLVGVPSLRALPATSACWRSRKVCRGAVGGCRGLGPRPC